MTETENSKDSKILVITFIATVIYVLYLEINPKITGIWLRKDHNNRVVLALHNLKDFFAYPFKEYRMWKPNMWDMNPYISIPIITSSIYFIKKYYHG
jgi:hypothetical protein